MMDGRETVDLTGEEFYDEDDLEELEEPDELDETADRKSTRLNSSHLR